MKKEKEKKVKEKKVKEKAVSEPKPEGRVREFLCGAVFSLLVGVGSVNIALVGLLFCFLYGFPQRDVPEQQPFRLTVIGFCRPVFSCTSEHNASFTGR